MTALLVVETAVLVVLCVLVAGLLRAYAAVLSRLHQLDGGAAAPSSAAPFRTAPDVPAPPVHTVQGRDEWAAAHDVAGTTLDGEVVVARTVQVEHDTVLAFLSSGCAGCVGFWEELADPRRMPQLSGRLLVVARDLDRESPAELRRLLPPGVDLLLSSQAWTDHDVPGSPFVVVVDGRTGRVKGHGTGQSFSQVAGLVAQAGGDSRAGAGARVVKPRADAEREADVDATLRAAGIGPGHPSLHTPVGGPS